MYVWVWDTHMEIIFIINEHFCFFFFNSNILSKRKIWNMFIEFGMVGCDLIYIQKCLEFIEVDVYTF